MTTRLVEDRPHQNTTARSELDSVRRNVEHAVKAVAQALLDRQISIGQALAVVTTAMGASKDEEATPREQAAAGREDHRASVVAEMARFEKEGKGRAAPMILARSNALDARDVVECETLANKYRRWRRAEKRAHARLPSAESTRKYLCPRKTPKRSTP
jgi:hypothetical protein